MQRGLKILILLTLLASACSNSDPGPGVESQGTPSTTVATTAPPRPPLVLEQARNLWTLSGPTSYHLATWQEGRWGMTTADTVVDGRIHRHRLQGDPETSLDPGPRSMFDLFDHVASDLSHGVDPVDVEYDPTTGAITRYTYDGTTFNVAVTPLGSEMAPIDVGSLTLAYVCYDGFLLINEDTSIGLRLRFPPDIDLSKPAELSSSGPSGTLSIGHHIFSYLTCLEGAHPLPLRPIVLEEWHLTAGTVTFQCDDAPSCDDPGLVVRATLRGGVASLPDGGRSLQLEDIELRDDCWKCGWD